MDIHNRHTRMAVFISQEFPYLMPNIEN